jgi:copper chaperone CopZ
MNSLKKTMMALILLLSGAFSNAQIKNTTTETFKIFGNCGMCKTAIEKAGTINKVAKVDWNKDTNMATLTYDSKQTNQDEILKRIALAGYDSEKFLAPDTAYSNLPGCCQYNRETKVATKMEDHKIEVSKTITVTETQDPSDSEQAKQKNQLQPVFDSYFELKDALIKTDGNSASAKASVLLSAINKVKMDKLEMEIHMVWMKVLNDLKEHSEHIADTKDIKYQRDHFMDLSKNIYDLIKVSKQETPTYYQHCPMANDGKGADWLSKENAIKNPYYGSQMLTCGKTVETIK